MVPYDTLLQNATGIITKCDRYYYNMRQKFITKYVTFFITKCDVYYKLRECNAKYVTKIYVPRFYTIIHTLSVPFYILLSIDLFFSRNIEKKNQKDLFRFF